MILLLRILDTDKLKAQKFYYKRKEIKYMNIAGIYSFWEMGERMTFECKKVED